MKKIILAIVFSIIMHLFSFSLFAQSGQGFIYGKITTEDNETFIGQIRWGDEEAFWTDMFNASKIGNENIQHLTDENLDEIHRNKGWHNNNNSWNSWNKKGRNSWWDSEDQLIHQFSCQFGEIKQINLKKWKKPVIILKDNTEIRISGQGYNDVGTEIVIQDDERGEIELDWDEVETVEFMAAPSGFKSVIGEPLYGTVETRNGSFTGLIQWDKDERVTTDVLDGSNKNRKRKIDFSKIKSIEKFGNSCDIVLTSGREENLRGSNDVNSGNRGIVITNGNMGRVEVKWHDFKRVEFLPISNTKLLSYTDFGNPKPIHGVVKTKDGASLSGKIVYDLDEAFDFELLNGELDDMEFQIPFRNIELIKPQRRSASLVKLKSSEEFVLEDAQDISSRNEGILVFNDQSKPIYIAWEEIEEIVFK